MVCTVQGLRWMLVCALMPSLRKQFGLESNVICRRDYWRRSRLPACTRVCRILYHINTGYLSFVNPTGLSISYGILACTNLRRSLTYVFAVVGVWCAQRVLRGRRGLVVTKSMEDDLRETIVWHAKRCGASLRAVDGIYEVCHW